MRFANLALSLLLATATFAQPVVGPEVTTPPVEFGDVAITPLRDGYVAAWSDAGRVHVAHLDATLQATDPPLDVLTTASNSKVTAIAIATNGSSVLLVWNEKRPGVAEAYVASISPDARQLVRGPVLINNTDLAPTAAVRNGKYGVASGDRLFVFNEALETESATPIGPFTAVDAATGELATVATRSETSCTGPLSCKRTDTYIFQSPSFERTFQLPGDPFNKSSSPLLHDPIVIPDGDHFIGVLATKTITDIFEMSPRSDNREWTLEPLQNSQTLSVAGNGNDVLVVTWRYPTLNGVVLRGDGTTSQPFAIARGGGYDFAKVIAAPSHDFVVLYRYDDGAEHSVLAGRVVHVQSQRQRSVR